MNNDFFLTLVFFIFIIFLSVTTEFSLISDTSYSSSKIIQFFLNSSRKHISPMAYLRTTIFKQLSKPIASSNLRALDETSTTVLEDIAKTQQITSNYKVTSPTTSQILMSLDIEVEKIGSFFNPFFIITPVHTPSKTPTNKDILYTVSRKNESDSESKWEQLVEYQPITSITDAPVSMNPVIYQNRYSFSYRIDSFNENKVFLASSTVRYKAYIPNVRVVDNDDDWPFWKVLIVVLCVALAMVIVIFVICICMNLPKKKTQLLAKVNESGQAANQSNDISRGKEEEKNENINQEEEIRRKSSFFNPVIKKEEIIVTKFHPMQEIEMADKSSLN